ncbi:PilC/PilY family type IV pilus protein [Salicola sp. Rm-C-2C1-2]|uniref:pilus assembly protein n=1 Tax=Salicola sp. Rm-C-2C1-2 TaxID=3141321 RepID=UPI0032E38FA2
MMTPEPECGGSMSWVIRNKTFYKWLSGIGLALLLWPSLIVGAELVDKPLFVGSKVQPNIMFLMDDSGSMQFEYMPNEISSAFGEYVYRSPWDVGSSVYDCGDGDLVNLNGDFRCRLERAVSSGKEVENQWYFSSKENTVYFDPDPEKEYRPPLKPNAEDDDDRMPDARYDNAWKNGYQDYFAEGGTTKDDLRDDFEHSGVTFDESGAFYYEFDGDEEGCESDPRQNKCYNYVAVNDTSADSDVRQRFANWYAYYRTRRYTARAAISEGFDRLGEKARLGWGTINTRSFQAGNVDGTRQEAVIQGVRPYGQSHRKTFYDFLYTVDANGGTPLRRALNGAGRYYEKNDRSWADDPSSSTSELRECRQSNTILMTDGFWSSNQPGRPLPGDIDSEAGELIQNTAAGDSYRYQANDFWSDSEGNTLADVAMDYWKRDIRSGLDNFVPSSKLNPAFWQHMVTHGVGLGVDGTLDADSVVDELQKLDPTDEEQEPLTEADLKDVNWPDPVAAGNGSPERIDDLLHAAMNSRGSFFSTSRVDEFAQEMGGLLKEIESEAASSSGVSFDVATIKEDALTFAASFDPASWSGDIQALPIIKEKDGDFTFPDTLDGGIWSAADQLDKPGFTNLDRTIITGSDGEGIAFRWDKLDSAQKADLEAGPGDNPQALLDFLRGARKQEGSMFRERASRLGDVVNSTPSYVGAPNAGWPDQEPYAPKNSPYSDFEFDQKDRTPVIYAGANDGMLHGFKATEDGGEEVLAYIPEYLYSDQPNQGLHALADPAYQHQYYVDLPPRTQDVYVDGEWRTILIGGSRTGASGIFALDVTDPAEFSESNATDIALWEFSDADDERLGRITQAPIITPAAWGNNGQDVRWTVFLPNGYKSGSQSTGFFMLDFEAGIQDGWSKKAVNYVEFDTGFGATGLSPLKVLDTDADGIADRVYAGDLEGNLWAASSRNGWGSVYSSGKGGNATPQPLFKARDGKGNAQPITAAPAVTRTPLPNVSANDDDFLVVLGTGEYEFEGAPQDDQTQSVYAVRDQGESGLDRDALVSRAFTTSEESKEGEDGNVKVRQSNGDKMDYNSNEGWYIDLPKQFERVTTAASIRRVKTSSGVRQVAFINSMIPDVNPCAQGGRGWLMAFGIDGRTPQTPVFLEFDKPIVGYQVGGLPNESETVGGGDKDYRTTTLSDGSLEGTPISPNSADVNWRLGWRELIQ